jgi:hypothetical protein
MKKHHQFFWTPNPKENARRDADALCFCLTPRLHCTTTHVLLMQAPRRDNNG